jgi:3-isopropylmalate/(R)-2-methylmalate dehydratase small subunit
MDKIIGKTIPLDMNEVDTDLIIPAQYLTSIKKEGYGKNLFRRLKDSDPYFVFNQEKYQGANVLVTKENFGCGSSREHAIWALKEVGIQAIIAISFADIFFSNAAKNGLVLICQSPAVIHSLLEAAPQVLQIDLVRQHIKIDNTVHSFEMDAFYRHCFIEELDELDYLYAHLSEIKTYEKRGGKK